MLIGALFVESRRPSRSRYSTRNASMHRPITSARRNTSVRSGDAAGRVNSVRGRGAVHGVRALRRRKRSDLR